VSDEMAIPMYSTGIGLVIEGIKRFDYEKSKERHTDPLGEEVSNKKAEKKSKQKIPKGESGPSRFLNTIKDWFENDTSA
jgi:cell division ATPase FtsA